VSDALLSSGDVCEIAGVHENNLDRWAAAWLTGRAAGGRGPGRHRRYMLIEVLAVYAGARWRAEGADPYRVAGVVWFVARLALEYMEAEFEQGRTFPVPAVMLAGAELPGGGVLIDPTKPTDSGTSPGVRELMVRLDLRRCWEEVKARAAEVRQRRQARRGHGMRNRATSNRA
jgi:hypothetical protein